MGIILPFHKCVSKACICKWWLINTPVIFFRISFDEPFSIENETNRKGIFSN